MEDQIWGDDIQLQTLIKVVQKIMKEHPKRLDYRATQAIEYGLLELSLKKFIRRAIVFPTLGL